MDCNEMAGISVWWWIFVSGFGVQCSGFQIQGFGPTGLGLGSKFEVFSPICRRVSMKERRVRCRMLNLNPKPYKGSTRGSDVYRGYPRPCPEAPSFPM